MTAPPFLAELTWSEAAEILVRRPVGLLPVGAIEAHGPHLPLDTDVIIALATAERAACRLESLGVPVLILPPISFTVSFVGMSFPGTSPVERGAFESYLSNLLSNLAQSGYCALICCNAHLEPAHVETVQTSCARAEQANGIPVRSPDQRSPERAARLGTEFQAGARHAGAYETSIVMAARPEVVRRQALSQLDPVWIDLPARLREGARTFTDAGASLGYFGDPRSATKEEGDRLLDILADIIVEECRGAGVFSSDY